MSGSIVDVPGVAVGSRTDGIAQTGCTVVVFDPPGAVCAVDVRGAAPGTRETDLLHPSATIDRVHAIVLAGGSAFGLDAATGVMRFLEERGIGVAVGRWRIPIVPAAILFDLFSGDGAVRPDAAMGYAAAQGASRAPVQAGRWGAGAGARVAKLAGFERARFGGIGSASTRLGEGTWVGSLVAVNAIGAVRDPEDAAWVAVPRETTPAEVEHLLLARPPGPPGANTTIGVVATDAHLTKAGAQRLASAAHDGLARTVIPAHLSGDGDTFFAASTGSRRVAIDALAHAAATTMAAAILVAVRAANAA